MEKEDSRLKEKDYEELDDGESEIEMNLSIKNETEEKAQIESINPIELISHIFSGNGDVSEMLEILIHLPYVPPADDEFLGLLLTISRDFSKPFVQIPAFRLLGKYTKQYPAITVDYFIGENNKNIMQFIRQKPSPHFVDFIAIACDSFTGFEEILKKTLIAQTLFQHPYIDNPEDRLFILTACNHLCEFMSQHQNEADEDVFKLFYENIFLYYQSLENFLNSYKVLLKATLNILKIVQFDEKFLEKNGPLEVIRSHYTNEDEDIEVLTFKILNYIMDQTNIKQSLPFNQIKDKIVLLINYAKEHDVLGYARTRIDDAHLEGQKEIIRLTCSVLKLYVPSTQSEIEDFNKNSPYFYVDEDELETSYELGLAEFLVEALEEAPYPIKIESIEYISCLMKCIHLPNICRFIIDKQIMTTLVELLPHITVYERAFYIVVSMYIALKKIYNINMLRNKNEEEDIICLEDILPFESLDDLSEYADDLMEKNGHLNEKLDLKHQMELDITPTQKKLNVVSGIFNYTSHILELYDEPNFSKTGFYDSQGMKVEFNLGEFEEESAEEEEEGD